MISVDRQSSGEHPLHPQSAHSAQQINRQHPLQSSLPQGNPAIHPFTGSTATSGVFTCPASTTR